MPPIRMLPAGTAHAFSATAPKSPTASLVRNLHITGAQGTPSQNLKFETEVNNLPSRAKGSRPTRHLNTSRALKANHDSSSIDFAYMPSIRHESSSFHSEQPMIPLLPQTRRTTESIVGTDAAPLRPSISTASGGGEGSCEVGALGEIEMLGVEMVQKGVEKVERGVDEGMGEIRRVWTGFVDDLFGPGKTA